MNHWDMCMLVIFVHSNDNMMCACICWSVCIVWQHGVWLLMIFVHSNDNMMCACICQSVCIAWQHGLWLLVIVYRLATLCVTVSADKLYTNMEGVSDCRGFPIYFQNCAMFETSLYNTLTTLLRSSLHVEGLSKYMPKPMSDVSGTHRLNIVGKWISTCFWTDSPQVEGAALEQRYLWL